MIPRRHLAWQTRYFKWYGYQYDFLNKPLLPFGCRAHISESNQTKLSDNSSKHYFVGLAPHTKQGILLYNPKTKLVIIRRSYQKLDT